MRAPDQQARLGARARAQLDDDLRPRDRRQLVRARFEDLGLSPREVVLRQLRDLLEERRAAVVAPTIRAEDIPTWIDDFFVYWMLSSQWFRHEVCGAFRRAVDARSEVEFLHQILVWVIKLIAGRGP